MAVGGVGHLVGIGFHIFGEDFSNFCNICCQVIFYGVLVFANVSFLESSSYTGRPPTEADRNVLRGS